MILKSEFDTVVLIDCQLESSTEMTVGILYAEGKSSIVTMVDIKSGKNYRVTLPDSILKNETQLTGVNVGLQYEQQ